MILCGVVEVTSSILYWIVWVIMTGTIVAYLYLYFSAFRLNFVHIHSSRLRLTSEVDIRFDSNRLLRSRYVISS